MARLVLAAASFSAWLVLLLAGWAFGGAVHLLLAAALFFFPWRAALQPVADEPGVGAPPPREGEEGSEPSTTEETR